MYTHSSCVTTSPHQHRWCCVLLHTYLGVPPQTPIQPTPVQMPFQVMPVTHPSHFTRVWGRGVHARATREESCRPKQAGAAGGMEAAGLRGIGLIDWADCRPLLDL